MSLWRIREVQSEFRLGKLEEKDYLDDLGLDGRIILKCLFKKWNGA